MNHEHNKNLRQRNEFEVVTEQQNQKILELESTIKQLKSEKTSLKRKIGAVNGNKAIEMSSSGEIKFSMHN